MGGEFLAECGEGITDPGRRGRLDGTFNQTITGKNSERLRQHLFTDAIDAVPQLIEPVGTSAQAAQNERCPSAGHMIEDPPSWTVVVEHVTSTRGAYVGHLNSSRRVRPALEGTDLPKVSPKSMVSAMPELLVEVFSDLVCPWCLLGKRRFEQALREFDHDADVRVRWRAFQLDPRAPRQAVTTIFDRMRGEMGMSDAQARAQLDHITGLATEVGLRYQVAEARPVNSFDAHRLQAYADDVGVGDTVRERLMRAYTEERADLGDSATLIRLAAEGGVDADGAARVLADGEYAGSVRNDGERARQLGITSVPSFVFAERHLIAGAQPVSAYVAALRAAR